jgi:uncharacterized protein involved in type VI secretion and phage assembly
MEKRFGEERVRNFCQQTLKNTSQQTDYVFLARMVKASGMKDGDWKQFEQDVIS